VQSEVKSGDILDGKYRVERVLGSGGMGTVVAAHHLKLDQKVAIKFLHAEALAHEHIVKRFASEARAAAKIRSQHVARVIDVGEFQSGAPFMVMEYLEGNDLSDELKKRGALPVEEALLYIIQACDALAEAHSAGIVHRDLKPANLFLTRAAGGAPITKVLDFGISKTMIEGGERGLTSTQMVMGTPHYMSPEQIRSTRDVDARSDVWALGVIIFELLTDNLPFDGESSSAIIASIISEPARPVTAFNPAVPGPLEQVIARALHRDKNQRFQNVAELARALLPFTAPAAASIVSNISRVVGGALETERPRPAIFAATAHGDPNKTVVDPRASAVAASVVQGTEANFGTTQFKQKSNARMTITLAAVAGVFLLVGIAGAWHFSGPSAASVSAVAVSGPAMNAPQKVAPAQVVVPTAVGAPPVVAAEPVVAAVQARPLPQTPAPVASPLPVQAKPSVVVKRLQKKTEKKVQVAAREAPKQPDVALPEKPAAARASGGGLLHMGLK